MNSRILPPSLSQMAFLKVDDNFSLDEEPVASRAKIKYIIGIDYGTTYTGVSYVTSNKTQLSDIVVLRAWPGRDGEWKTPTRIAYGRENGRPNNHWGFQIEPNMISYSWTKLLLDDAATKSKYDDPKLAHIAGNGIFNVPPFRNAAGVCEDFLREIRRCVFARLEKERGKDFVQMTPVDCYITIPAIWSDKAKEATRTAAINAGFASRPEDSISMIPEPEAAAITTLIKDTAPDAVTPVKVGDNIMICDCGGGTVDLTTYAITATEPVLAFEELVVGTGGKCGSTYIDRNLHDLMSKRFGSSFDKLPPAKKGPGSRFMQSFEVVKRDFGSSQDERMRDVGPLRVDCDNPNYYDDDECMVRLSHSDLKGLFDPVIGQILALIAQQTGKALAKNHLIDRLILVGGFGDSPYLFKQVKSWCVRNGNIPLFCPEHPQAAIVLGAALRGLLGTVPTSTRCRRHYGYEVGKNFRPGVDKEKHSWIDIFQKSSTDDGKMCTRMEWIIAKDEEITPETFKCVDLYHQQEGYEIGDYSISLYSTAADDAPERKSDTGVEKVGTIVVNHSEIDLGSVPSLMVRGKRHFKLDFEVRIAFGDAKGVLDFSSWVDGKQSGTARISYGNK